MITKFTVQSFKSIESVELELGHVNVFLGANGGGKSNLIEAFGVLAAAAFGRVDEESLVRRGCRPGGYYRPLFREGRKDAETVVGAEGIHASYWATLSNPTPPRRTGWEFRREVWKEGEQTLVNRDRTNGTEQGDPQAGFAALRLAETPMNNDAAVFLKKLAGFSIYEPDTLILRGLVRDSQVREPVGLSGGRLADAALEVMKDEQRGSKLLEVFRSAVEWFAGFGKFEVADPEGSKSGLVFMDRFFRTDNNHHYFLGPNVVNEGVLYMLFVAVLCLHPEAPTFLAVENGDHGLNPLLVRHLMRTMCDWILTSTEAKQILMTTHNPLLLDGLPLTDERVRLFTVDRDNKGRTQVQRFMLTERHREMAGNGWTLSRMWVNGLIGGIPNV